MDISKLSTSDKVIAGSSVALLIFMFLPWYGVDQGLVDYSNSGWDYFFGGILPFILALVMVAQVLISRFSPSTKLPDPPVSWGQVHMIAGVAAAVLLILRLLIGSDEIGGLDTGFDLDREFGLFLAVLAGIGLAVGGYLKWQEEKSGAGGSVAGPGTTPPSPF